MRRLVYAGSTVYTGDRTADALLAYGAAVARRGTTVVAEFPARDTSGLISTARILLGPFTQVLVQDMDADLPLIEDDSAVVEELHEQTVALERSEIPDGWPPDLLR
jgi:hypothetical protein